MFEVFDSSHRSGRRERPAAITIQKIGRLALNQAATRWLATRNVEFVHLLWDREAKKIGIRPSSERDRNAFYVSFTLANKSASFAAKGFLEFIRIDYTSTLLNLPPAQWNAEQAMIEVDVPSGTLLPSNA